MVRKIIITLTIGFSIMACAPMAASSAPVLTPEQVSLVQQTCDRVMGLAHSGVYRDQCQDSLSQSLARKVRAEGNAASYGDCRHDGLREGSAAFSTCMLDREKNRSGATAQPVSLAYDASTPENAKGYFDVNNSVHWRREQYSCAQLGLIPGTGAFGQCVAGLEGALLSDPN